ncbi:hypothetical protein F5884DRAFT_312914 [Xylogone sp. PMI_703]|nr:hypothetical protein F5884DRAFT_312914 [Xylogone sp. PMI_703]
MHAQFLRMPMHLGRTTAFSIATTAATTTIATTIWPKSTLCCCTLLVCSALLYIPWIGQPKELICSYSASNSIIDGDFVTVQFYSASQYLFLLKDGTRWVSSDNSAWIWNNIVDPNGNTWSIHVNGNCGKMSYQSSLQSTQGFVTMSLGDRNQIIDGCGNIGEGTSRCIYVESSHRDSTCPSGSEPPFCDYIETCSPIHSGTPTYVPGGN